ncbi:MAG: AMP-binding protein, partial [Syntrophales bacterium]|nr:AMP-binding protein [Syntrophales bacterium]
MKNNYLKAAYDNAPQFIRNFVSYVPFPLRMGRSYRETVAFLKKSQYWPNDAIKNYQLTQLKAVVDNAFKTVPYYKKKYKKLGLTGSSITSLSDFQRFPLLSRDDVLLNYNALKSSSYNNLNTYEGMTGGTTGASVKILFSMKSPFIEWGYIHALWSRIGFLPKHKRVALIGTPFLGNNRMTHCFNPFHNELQLSAIDLDESSIILYAKAISAFQPSFFYGLPSAWMVLGAFLLENNLIPKGIKGVLCGSEQITEDQRNFLESTFKCPVYSWYGQTEKVTLAGECECSQDYHIFFEYGYTELIDEQGDVINSPGKTGEIIATGFINSAMPLIRYRTGDMAQYADGNCP